MELKRWRLIDSGVGSAAYNMAVDEALLHNFKEGDLPILRLYGWEPSVSLGRFSNVYESLNVEALQKQKLPLVRRMTGGGVLIHGGDLSYSLILPKETLRGRGVKESYRYLCQFLLKLYENLGLSAGFAQDLDKESRKSKICMAANEPYDIIVNGKKMGGNAQRYATQTLFQHGSIPISLDEALFKDIFLKYSGVKNIFTLDRVRKEIDYKELAHLLTEAFTRSFGVTLVGDALSVGESCSSDQFLAQKYSQKRWNMDAR